jgi:WD40 repeat protein
MRCPFCNAANPHSTGACRVCGGPLHGTNRSSSARAQSNETTVTPSVPRVAQPIRDLTPPQLTPPVLLCRKAREANAPRVVAALFWPADNETSLPVLALENGSLQIWDGQRDVLHSLSPRRTPRKPVLTTCSACAPESGMIATGDEAGQVRLQRLEHPCARGEWQLQALDTIEAHRGRVLSLAARGKRLYSGGSDGTVVVTPLPGAGETKKVRQKPQVILDGLSALSCLAVSPDGRFLALGADDGQVQMWRFPTNETQARREWTSRSDASRVKSLIFSPNGNMLVSGHSQNGLRLWAAHTGHPLQLVAETRTGAAPPAFAPDSRLMAAACAEDKVNLFDSWTGATRHPLPLVLRDVQALAFSPATGTPARETRLVAATSQEIVTWKVTL